MSEDSDGREAGGELAVEATFQLKVPHSSLKEVRLVARCVGGKRPEIHPHQALDPRDKLVEVAMVGIAVLVPCSLLMGPPLAVLYSRPGRSATSGLPRVESEAFAKQVQLVVAAVLALGSLRIESSCRDPRRVPLGALVGSARRMAVSMAEHSCLKSFLRPHAGIPACRVVRADDSRVEAREGLRSIAVVDRAELAVVLLGRIPGLVEHAQVMAKAVRHVLDSGPVEVA